MLDGGFATELERQGTGIDGPLWSARALLEAPEAVLAVHRSYLEAGADVLLTGSYQVSSMGFLAQGLAPAPARQAAADALRTSVELATEARARAGRPDVLVAASLGPYGAALANGAEFHGAYGFPSEREQHATLVQFHAERIQVLEETEADLLAFETLPSLAEARAVVDALAKVESRRRPGAWLAFTCRDEQHTAHGEELRACAALLDQVPEVLAIGVNCTAPALIAPLLRELRTATAKPLLAYPNSGEGWDSNRHCWTGTGELADYEAGARSWFAAGAQLVGGCCRTTPANILAVRRAAALFTSRS